MLKRSWQRAAATLALCALPLLACDSVAVRVELSDFGTGATDGIWLWRSSGASYVRQCRIDISNSFFSGGREVVSYLQSCPDGASSTVEWLANVERPPGDPATVQLVLVYRRSGGSAVPHRATAFNAQGESSLSDSSLML